MRPNRITPIALVALLVLTNAYGHHSLEGTYFMDQRTAIEGTLVELSVRNPHSFVLVEVRDVAGKVTRWGCEWGGASQLKEAEVDVQLLKAGDRLRLSGPPGRDPESHRILLRDIRSFGRS